MTRRFLHTKQRVNEDFARCIYFEQKESTVIVISELDTQPETQHLLNHVWQ